MLARQSSADIRGAGHPTVSPQPVLGTANLALRSALRASPGFQEFGLPHIAPMQLAAYTPDIKPHVAECRFYNCTHLHEPGCGVISAVKSASGPHPISASRYKIYSELFAEISAVHR